MHIKTERFTKGCFHLIQSAPEILKDGLCPAMLFPSKACECKDFSLRFILHVCSSFNKRFSSTVTRRCLPALEKIQGGVVVVGNQTTFVDGNTSVNATDLLEASKSVLVTETLTVAQNTRPNLGLLQNIKKIKHKHK